MSAYERHRDEQWPTGTFGHAQPPPQPPPRPIHPWTPEEQARHWNDLGEAIADWHWNDNTRQDRHLRIVDNPASDTAA